MSSTVRPTASIVIPAWNAWEHTRACLDSLRATLGPADQVVVVDNGSTDDTPAGLGAYPWVEVVTNAENRGFAGGCNQGASYARGDVVVFLNSDTVLPPGWLDELVLPFADPGVGACGPRSDNVSGWQAVPGVPWDPDEPAGFFAFASAWRERHQGRTTQVERLVGFCLAVRRTTVEALGGFDERFEIGGYEDDDLCRRIAAEGLRLLMAEGSLIHHACHASFDANEVDWAGHELANKSRYDEKWAAEPVSVSKPAAPVPLRPTPLLSACLIVKDEEEMLPACLESIRDAVDEIVVYDTGSSDGTVAIARAAGAVVIEGSWHDDFARARNAALAGATGEWVLSIDADETLQADPAALRHQLAEVGEGIEAFLTSIENLFGPGNARSVHTAIRVFRRANAVWHHRIHEQVAPVDDPDRTFSCSFLAAVRLLHHGYAADVFAGRNKAERNLELARAAMEDGDTAHPYATMNYGRALVTAGRTEEAVDYLRAAVDVTDDVIIQRLAVVNLVAILIKLERYDEALAEIARMRRFSRSQVAADIAEGRCRIAMGDTVEGLAILSRLPVDARDDDGMEFRPHMLAAIRGEALASLGRYGEAADIVLEAVRSDGVLEADMGELVDWLIRADRSPTEITTGLAAEDLVTVLGRVMRQPPVLADLLLEGAFETFPERMEPLAVAARVAPALPVVRALVWSARLRARGLSDACPLVAIAGSAESEPAIRVRAAAAAWGSFGPDDRLIGPVRVALDMLAPDRRRESEEELARLAPTLSEVLGGSSPLSGISVPATATATAAVAPAGPSPRPVLRPASQRPSIRPSPPPPARPVTRRTVTVPVAEHPRRGGVNVVGPFEGTGREADVARAVVGALRTGGTEVSTTSYHRETRDAKVDFAHLDAGDYPFDVNLLVLHPDDLTDFVLDYGPASFDGRYVVGLWLWDFEAPSNCMPDSSRIVHEVWVPTRAGATTAEAAGASSAHVMPLPIGPSPTGWDRADLGLPDGTVVSCRVDYDGGVERQNPRGAIDAFTRAFAPGDGPHLVVDTLHADRYPTEHAGLVAAAGSRPDITFLSGGDRSPAERDAVIALSDGFVSLHRADSCLVAVGRALAWGVPTVVTGDRATSGFPTRREAFVVPSQSAVIPADMYRYPTGSAWSEPDIDAAAAALRAVVDDPEAVALRTRRAMAEAGRRHSDREAARTMLRRLDAVAAARYGTEPLRPRRRTAAHR